MNILFSSDDNYARHMGVCIYSLLCHNTKIDIIRLYVVDNDISSDNKEKIKKVVSEFCNAELNFIPFKNWADRLHLDMAWPISLSSYARLFIGEMLPEGIEKVLYLDCDVIINGSLLDLWNTDLGYNVVGAVQDQVSEKVKVSIGLKSLDRYFNAGMLLINLNNWRKEKIGEKSLYFIKSHQGQVIHHDQGVLNGLLHNLWIRLPIKYNVMTIHYIMSLNKIRKYYKDKASYYNQENINLAKDMPIIIHYTPSFTTHPWEDNCIHPLGFMYNNILDKTPWARFPKERDMSPWYVSLINWYYCHIY